MVSLEAILFQPQPAGSGLAAAGKAGAGKKANMPVNTAPGRTKPLMIRLKEFKNITPFIDGPIGIYLRVYFLR
jgi:hypothetical protein